MPQPPSSLNTASGGGDPSIVSAITRLARELVGALTSDHVVQRLNETLDQLLTPDGTVIWLLDGNADPRVASQSGTGSDAASRPLFDYTMAHGATLMSNDVPRQLAVSGVTLDPAPAGWLGCPLMAGTPLGAVTIVSSTPGRLMPAHLGVVEAIASQAALALENKRLLSMLSVGKREWEQTVDAIRLGICVVDHSGHVLRVNRAFSAMVDVPVTDIAGRPCVALVPPTWADAVSKTLVDPTTAESSELVAGNRVFHLSVLSLTGTREGGAALIFDDQTERRRLQDQLIQSEKMSAIGQLIAGVAHDLNNPLASVIGFSDYLVESGTVTTPELREPLRAIQLEAERAANIVKNLLTFARKQEHQRRVLSIRQVVNTTLTFLKNQLIATRIETQLEIPRDLPPVHVDAVQIQQVFLNLINNAAQAIDAGQTPGTICIRAEPWLDGVAVTVEDSGPGVPEDLEKRIFEPFFTTKPEGDGTGLGLSICQGIVKEHGGRLSYARSTLGGAAFRVELPAGEPEAEQAPSAPRPTGALKILVIDDEPHIQHYMQATLEASGHAVVIASDGTEGLDRATSEPFDVIISDLRMPGLGGRQMFETLRQSHPDVADRIVFSTGDTVRGDTLQFLEALGRPYLRKPFSLAELRTILSQAVAAG